jgi:hypothetical protein
MKLVGSPAAVDGDVAVRFTQQLLFSVLGQAGSSNSYSGGSTSLLAHLQNVGSAGPVAVRLSQLGV